MGKDVTSDKVFVSDNFNGHVDGDMGGFGEVYGALGLGK